MASALSLTKMALSASFTSSNWFEGFFYGVSADLTSRADLRGLISCDLSGRQHLMSGSVRIIRSGLLTTVQDPGRPRHRHFGVPVSGAMDRLSSEIANRLIDNSSVMSLLEMTLTGDELEFTEDSLIAITGADMQPVVVDNGVVVGRVPQMTPVAIRRGTRLKFQAARRGCRCYLAVSFGFRVQTILGSRSTDLRAGFGGHCGRALQAGDEIEIDCKGEKLPAFLQQLLDQLSEFRTLVAPPWYVRPLPLFSTSVVTLRALRAPHFGLLNADSQIGFWNSEFKISPESDRMGYRLSGPEIQTVSPASRFSRGQAVGTIQLPPDGQPILLMADCAPTGGYLQVAHVITADLLLAAQLRPGQSVRFCEVDIDQAQQLLKDQRDEVERCLAFAELVAGSRFIGTNSAALT